MMGIKNCFDQCGGWYVWQ